MVLKSLDKPTFMLAQMGKYFQENIGIGLALAEGTGFLRRLRMQN